MALVTLTIEAQCSSQDELARTLAQLDAGPLAQASRTIDGLLVTVVLPAEEQVIP